MVQTFKIQGKLNAEMAMPDLKALSDQVGIRY